MTGSRCLLASASPWLLASAVLLALSTAHLPSARADNPSTDVINEYDDNGDGMLNEDEFTSLMERLRLKSTHEHEEEEEHDSHEEEEEEGKCPTIDHLFEEYDTTGNGSFDSNEFKTVSAALIKQFIDGCPEATDCTKPSDAEAWGGALGSVIGISLVSLIGVCCLPCVGRWRVVNDVLISFAVGALVGDAILHIIPHIFGGHAHGGSALTDPAKEDDRAAVWLSCVIVVGFFTFFMIEKASLVVLEYGARCFRRRGGAKDGKVFDDAEACDCEGGECRAEVGAIVVVEAVELGKAGVGAHPDADADVGPPAVAAAPASVQHLSEDDGADSGDSDHGSARALRAVPSSGPRARATGPGKGSGRKARGVLRRVLFTGDLRPVGILNVMSDFLHNFVDGLALGAAWQSQVSVGVATTVAVLLHEVPQEIADFAILTRSGFSVPHALAVNFAISLTAVVGTLIGVAAGGGVTDGSQWLLAFVAGSFLYIAIGDLVPELNRNARPLMSLLVQPFCMVCGFAVMLLLAVFEQEAEC